MGQCQSTGPFHACCGPPKLGKDIDLEVPDVSEDDEEQHASTWEPDPDPVPEHDDSETVALMNLSTKDDSTLYLNFVLAEAKGVASHGNDNAQGASDKFPIPDDRVPIKDLLMEHRAKLKELATELKADFENHPYDDPQCFDELFLIRFLLSKKCDVSVCASEIRKALAWRAEHILLIKEAEDFQVPSALSHEALTRMNCFMGTSFHFESSFGDPILVSRAGCANYAEVVKDMDSLVILMKYFSEVANRLCDLSTRRRGHLVKLHVINDMNNFTPSSLFVVRKFLGAQGQQSKRNEFLYPQMLGKYVVVNSPAAFVWLFNIAKPLISKSAVEKVHVHGILKPDESSLKAKDLPLPFLGNDAERMPTFLGGRCECPGGCVGFNIANDWDPPPAPRGPKDLESVAQFQSLAVVKHLRSQQAAELTKKTSKLYQHVKDSITHLIPKSNKVSAKQLSAHGAKMADFVSDVLQRLGVRSRVEKVYQQGSFVVLRLQNLRMDTTSSLGMKTTKPSSREGAIAKTLFCLKGIACICSRNDHGGGGGGGHLHGHELACRLCEELPDVLPPQLENLAKSQCSLNIAVEVVAKSQREQAQYFFEKVQL